MRLPGLLQPGLQGIPVHLDVVKLYWDDVLALVILAPIAWSLISHFLIPEKAEEGFHLLFTSPQRQDGLLGAQAARDEETRDISRKLKDSSKDVVLFWGSQSGRAARLARQLARELQSVCGIAATVEDLELYDHKHLETLSKDKVVGFVVSTFGEGDPPDNASGLWEYLQELPQKNGQSLAHLQFFVFGLGSSRYEHYNKFAAVVGDRLAGAGAQRIGTLGRLDEAAGTEDTWVSWKDDMLPRIRSRVPARLQHAIKSIYEPDIELVDRPQAGSGVAHLHHAADLASAQSQGRIRTHALPISASRLLSARGSRAYLHVELDLAGAKGGFTYETGDHLAIWPTNPTQEVELLGSLFGWDVQKMMAPVSIKAKLDLVDVGSLPLGTVSRDSLLRRSLDISGPVSRHKLGLLAHFAPTARAERYIKRLMKDDGEWKSIVVGDCLTYARIMKAADPAPGITWPEELFAMLVQTIPQLQPRYYSISSSPVASPSKVSVTVGVVASRLPSGGHFHGLATNYLLRLHDHQEDQAQRILESETAPNSPTGLRRSSATDGPGVQVHVRSSNFRAPADCSRPMVMVAAGSGIAPFRAFIQDRVNAAEGGRAVARTVLFFGCRDQGSYLYKADWTRLEREHDFLSVNVAFSRAGTNKEYVQDRIRARQGGVAKLLLGDANLYICGSTDMAAGAKEAIADVLVAQGMGTEESKSTVAAWKKEKRIQEDVW